MWKLTLGVVIVVLICGIGEIKCCSGGGGDEDEETEAAGSTCDNILTFCLLPKKNTA